MMDEIDDFGKFEKAHRAFKMKNGKQKDKQKKMYREMKKFR